VLYFSLLNPIEFAVSLETLCGNLCEGEAAASRQALKEREDPYLLYG
jgi:hypothetical protein